MPAAASTPGTASCADGRRHRLALPSLINADQNLAEMAQRLEAALRRPAGDSKPRPRRRRPPNRRRVRAARRLRPVPHPRSESSGAPPVAPPGPKSGFEHLENEMASLLGRPKSPS